MNKFIIDTPKLQTLRLKYSSALLTLIFWVIWFYLWVPLITVAGWWFQIRFFQKELVMADGFDAFIQALPTFIAITLALTGTLALWAFYNFSRFKGIDRRKPLPPVQKNDFLQLLNISEIALDAAQSNKISTIVISEKGEITLRETKLDSIYSSLETAPEGDRLT